jgi:hypothetical protein
VLTYVNGDRLAKALRSNQNRSSVFQEIFVPSFSLIQRGPTLEAKHSNYKPQFIITGSVDVIHSPGFEIGRNTTFRKLELHPSSGVD